MSNPVVIARLLPELLSINGSSANADILAATLGRMGHAVEVVDVTDVGQAAITPDLVSVGSGSTSALHTALTALIPMAPRLHNWAKAGVSFVAIGMGWDVLGQDITFDTGEVQPGGGLFPSSADYRPGRFAGEVAGKDYLGRDTAGYINQLGVSTLHRGQPLMSISHQSAPIHHGEGIVEGVLMGTKLGGPLMSLNPHLRDDVVNQVLARRGLSGVGACVTPGFPEFHARTHDLARAAREAIVARLHER